MVDEKTSEELEREAMSDAGIEAIMKIYRDAQEVMDQIVPYELAMNRSSIVLPPTGRDSGKSAILGRHSKRD